MKTQRIYHCDTGEHTEMVPAEHAYRLRNACLSAMVEMEVFDPDYFKEEIDSCRRAIDYIDGEEGGD